MSLPSLSALRAFEATARLLSFTRAASELGMTQAGVSYQIRVLEERLGAALFLRKPGGIALTDLGRRLSAPTTDAFAQLRETWASGADTGETLTISALPTFATNWLAPRLGRFQLRHPRLAVRMQTSDNLTDFAREDVDLAIRYGKGGWRGLAEHKLFDVTFTPMLAPALAARADLSDAAGLLELPWIDEADPCWVMWLQSAGVAHRPCAPRASLQLGAQLHEARAAIAGTGVAILTPRFFRTEIAGGALVRPFAHEAGNGNAYWLVYPTARRNRPAIRAFRQFILDELAADPA